MRAIIRLLLGHPWNGTFDYIDGRISRHRIYFLSHPENADRIYSDGW